MQILPFTAELLDDVYRVQLGPDESWSKAQLSAELTNPCALGFCAVLAGEVVGYVSLHIVCGEATINNIVVSSEHRKKRVASRLLTNTVNSLYARKATRIFLEVRSKNEPAKALYRSLGFEQNGLRKGFYRDPDDDALLYVKELDDNTGNRIQL